MDWYPLWNSLRIAAISTFFVFFFGIFAAYYIAKLPRLLKGVLDVIRPQSSVTSFCGCLGRSASSARGCSEPSVSSWS